MNVYQLWHMFDLSLVFFNQYVFHSCQFFNRRLHTTTRMLSYFCLFGLSAGVFSNKLISTCISLHGWDSWNCWNHVSWQVQKWRQLPNSWFWFLRLWEDTLMIFTSDNGGWHDYGGFNWPLRGEKTTLWEGGVRGVSFVHGNMLGRRGVRCKELLHVTDWYPTLVNLVGTGIF